MQRGAERVEKEGDGRDCEKVGGREGGGGESGVSERKGRETREGVG